MRCTWQRRGARLTGIAAAVAGASAVLAGALAAHTLSGSVSARMLEGWQTAVRFQFWHALALAVLAVVAWRTRAAAVAAGLFVLGIVLFCGSLYALALGAPRVVGAAAPLGGAALVGGWIAFGMALFCAVGAGHATPPPSVGGGP